VRAGRGLRWGLGVLAAAVGALAVVHAMAEGTDFDGFHRAGEVVLGSGRLSTARDVSRYPPTFQMLHVPLATLPLGAAALAWYLISLAALAALPRQIERLGGGAPSAQRLPWIAAAPFLVDNLLLGQSGPVLLYLSARAVADARSGRRLAAGCLLGLATAFKVLPGLLLLVPWVLDGGDDRVGPLRARLTTLAGWLASLVVLGAALSLLVGADEAWRGTTEWVAHVREEQTPWGLVEHDRSLRYNNQGVAVTLARTLGDLGGHVPDGATPLAEWSLSTVWTLSGVVLVLAVAGLALAAARARRVPADEAWPGLFAMTALVSLVASPLVWTHYFLWVLPALVVLRRQPSLVATVGAIMAAGLASPAARGLGLHMACTLGLLMLVARELLAPVATGGGTVPSPHGSDDG